MQVNVTFEGKDASFAATFAEQMSLMGPEGKSAYHVAVDNGFTGTEKEWLSSLKGKDGQRGADGKAGKKGEKGDPFTYEDFTKEQLEDLRGPKDPTLVRTDVNGKIPASVIPDNVGGVQPDWDETDDNSKAYIKNKPFGDFTAHIKWNGDTSGLEKITIESPYASAVTLYKVYNGTISEEELNGGTIVIDGKEKKLGMGKDVMVIPRDGFIISHPTSLNMMEYIVALNDCQFSSQNPNLSKPYMTKGVYFAEGVTEIRPSKPFIKQIDPKFIPELDYAEKTELQNINNELLKKADLEVVNEKLLSKSNTGHNHDDIYYRKQTIDNLLTNKASYSHNHNNLYLSKQEVTDALDSKQDKLTFDSTPTEGSANPVTSDGVKKAVNEAVEIAYGKKKAYVFDTVEQLDIWLTYTTNTEKLSTGDAFYIRATDSPDYWWDSDRDTKQILETTKVDLSEYAEVEYVNAELSKKAEKEHKHDDRYNTKEETSNALLLKADLVDGVVPKSQLPNDIGVQADWNETDESSPSYIHNKTHGIVGAGLGYTLNDDGTYIPVDAEKDCGFLSGSRLAKFVYVSDKVYTVDELLGRTIKTKNLYLGDDTRVYDEYRDIEITADLVTQVADGWTIIDADSEMPIISVITESIAGADVGYGFSLPSNVGTYLVHLDKNPNSQDGYVFGSYKVDIGEEVKTLDPMFLPSVTEMKDFTKEVTQVVNTSLEQAKASGEFDGANGADGYTPVKGVDYFTDEEKAEMVAELSQIEVPTIVSSVDEMTDTSKHYVLEGYIYSSQKVVTQGGTTSPNMFTPTEDCLNMRLSGSTGSTSSNPGSFITDFIPVTNIANETQFIVRLNREVVDYKENKLVYYNASKTRLGTNLLEVGTNTTISNGETVTDIKKLSASSSATPSSWSDVAYIRIQYCLHLTNNIAMSDIENCEVTFDVNNVVTEETIKYQWVNSGISYAPTFRTDLIGVVGEDNVIYLSENLPSGTYTLKYGDETYETIGTITVM